MSTAFPVLSRSDHKLLRSESCSGYTDVFGNWNTGFYCPQSESKAAVYCCGTETYKYCCTAKDPNDETPTEVSQSNPYSIRAPLIIGIVSGLVCIAFFVTLATCFFCPCCLFHKKRTANIPAGLYRLQCGTSSTTSPLVNMNSHSSNLNTFTRLSLVDYGNNTSTCGQPVEQNFGSNGFNINTNTMSMTRNSFPPIASATVTHTQCNINNNNNNNNNNNRFYSNGFHSNQYEHQHFNPIMLSSSSRLDQQPPPQQQIEHSNYEAGQINLTNQMSNNCYFQPPLLIPSSHPPLPERNDIKIYSTSSSSSTFVPRCRASYTNELTGSPCFTNNHLEHQPISSTTTPTMAMTIYPSSLMPYNYPNLESNSSCSNHASRNSSSNAFSTSTLPLYRNSSIRNGGVRQLKHLPTSRPENILNTLDKFSKSVHFADKNQSENENGCSTTPGNSFTTIEPMMGSNTVGMESCSSSNRVLVSKTLSESPTTTTTPRTHQQQQIHENNQVNFNGLPTRLQNGERSTTSSSLCEILTVL